MNTTLCVNQTAATFEGIGALSAGASSRLLIDYPEPQRSEILDFLFKPKFGASLQHLKVEIGGDVDSTDGTEPSIARTREEFLHPKPEYFQRGYAWWLMKEARKRNPKILFDALQWGAPGWIGDGNFYSQDNADFVVAFIKGAKKYHDIDISFCGGWNERPHHADWFIMLRKTLDAAGLARVGIVAADEVGHWNIAETMKQDAALRDAVQVIGTHYPRHESTPAARSFGKPLWSSEDGPWSGEWDAKMKLCPNGLAPAYNRNYVLGGMTKTIIWSPVTSYYDILPLPGSGLMLANQPWSGHYEVKPAIWVTAHTTQFIEPGWRYLAGGACAMLPGGGSQVAAVSPDGRQLSIVIETFGAKAAQPLSFTVTGLACPRLRVWRSTAKEQFVRLADLEPAAGAFAITVEPDAIYSFTTTDGQCKGMSSVPPSAPFPLPYREDFESYTPGATPGYLSDFFGAFEVARRSDGGQCLRQVITRRGIEWVGDHDPVTLIGSPGLRDYEIACDVHFVFTKAAWIFGRIVNLPHGKRPPIGYGLRINPRGDWLLQTSLSKPKAETPDWMPAGTVVYEDAENVALLTGTHPVVPGSWHRIGLRFKGSEITVLMDGREAGRVTNTLFQAGLAGLGSEFEEVEFDNLGIF
jgi:hypothetical protein